MALLAVEDLTFTYPLCDQPAIRNVTFEAEKGDFIVVCGATGSGKSTLLRLLKRELAPLGTRTGTVRINGVPQQDLPARRSAGEIGYVAQKPEQQLVTDKVWHELAFGLENQGVQPRRIGQRVAEMAAYFGMEDWYDRPVSDLSGGQKQLLNLAAVMVMQPSILILDEPTAQLDPIAASEFIATVRKLNRDFSLTVIVAEHRLEEVVPLCDRMLVLDGGSMLAFDPPRTAAVRLSERRELLCAMPAATRLYHTLHGTDACPLDVREGRQWIERHFDHRIDSLPSPEPPRGGKPALQLSGVWFRYGRDLPDVLRGTDLTVYENEILCLLGGNGSGKSTLLAAAADLIRPYSGSVKVFDRPLRSYRNQTLYRQCLAMLPQDVQTVFLKNTVAEELAGSGAGERLLDCDLSPLYGRHPYDLSGGEQQLVALAKVLATEPKLLLLDEPTKGLDAFAKHRFCGILRKLKEQGVTVVIVTHDVEFACACADRCAMLFRGEVVSDGAPAEFFAANHFYTTAACRMTRGYYHNAVTVEQVAALCLQNPRGGGQRA